MKHILSQLLQVRVSEEHALISIKARSYLHKSTLLFPTRHALFALMLFVWTASTWAQPTEITSLSQLTSTGDFIITADINASGYTSLATFSGTLTAQAKADGTFPVITGLSEPLFTTATDATISNIMLQDVSISGDGENVGAITCVAEGYTRIYNCGILPNDASFSGGTHPSVSTTGSCAGSLVGKLDGDSRVVNCFSFADVTSSGSAAGIVGNNICDSDASVIDGKYAKLKTMVVNCMYYGNISASTIYPVYGGKKIINKGTSGINNYNFYSVGCTFSSVLKDYNCSWPAKEEYLTRYEFYRNLLNSNRELCGWWVGAPSAPSTMSTTEVQAVPKDASLIAKWVLDPAVAPYPILKPFGKYASPVNIDADASWRESAKEWEGKKLGTLNVSVNGGAHHAGSKSLELTITDMDTTRTDYCYRKVQLPYYNSVFGNPNGGTWEEKYGGNYGDYVVIGWKVSASGGTMGELVENWETGYNFADRNCTAKDANRVFAQGGYYYVPEGVTSITITAQWASAIYLDNTDRYYDRVSVSSFPSNGEGGISNVSPFEPAGTRPTTLGNGKTVQIGNISSKIPSGGSVYGNAIVLVGNHQFFTGGKDVKGSANSDGCTIMSADFDFDEEPDHCLIWQLGTKTTRQNICPIRFDFLPVAEMGLAMKEDGSTQYYSLGCYRPLGHFEVTETSLIHFGQFEFSNKNRTVYAPLILNGGIYDQYTKGTNNNAFSTADDKIDYIIIGGNVRMPSFTPGAHVNSNAKFPTRHCAVNVIGGSIDYLYLTGNYNEGVTPNADNPHCYIDGSHIKQVAAAGKEGINGDVYFKINHAKIWEFYGGSTMDMSTGDNFKIVKGNIDITINNSIVDKYCGGPKFGDMDYANSKTVTTNANNTTFGVYYGGGNGGTSYVQYAKTDVTAAASGYNWNASGNLNSYTAGEYRNRATGYQADYDMEIINVSTGTNRGQAVFRTYFYAAQFSATNTGPITNNLTGCTVLTNFYGGGNLGGVKGSVTSTLTGTHVLGSAFGAGFSATIPDVIIHNRDKENATIDINTGIVTPQSGGTSTTYTWTNETSLGGQTLSTSNPAALNVDGKNYYYTEISLDNLGTVTGEVTLSINDGTIVEGSVFGGGEMSGVGGSIVVNMNSGSVGGDVYGGGAKANTNTSNVTSGYGTDSETIASTDTHITNVNLHGGTIDGDVYGGGLGVLPLDSDPGVEAIVYGDVMVKLNEVSTDDCVVKGVIFGCNNLNGTPKGNVTLHIYRTKGYEGHWRTGYDSTGNPQYADDSEELLALFEDVDDAHHSYELAAVYGGGNLAAYVPVKALGTEAEQALAFAHVIIDGCGETSIRQVYGGGNAASAPGTQVDINGTYEIEEVYGGGNGKDPISKDGGVTYIDNPGANVGYYEYADDDPDAATQELRELNFSYGNGRANMLIHGGRIHRVYGGSNTKGNVREVALTLLEDATGCPFNVDEAYGGGKRALMDGRAILEMACIPGLKSVYGGAEAANINNNVELNITNGHFNRVFGGNNISGTISGTITINIEETGCHLLTIGQLYGGGNQASYTAPEGEHGPTLNVRSFTSIGDIYGGGYGKTAKVTGDTYVNINVCNGNDFSGDAAKLAAEEAGVAANHSGQKSFTFVEYQRTDDGGFVTDDVTGDRLKETKTVDVYLPPFTHGKIGAINNIYGGGNEAPVIGNTHVFIGTKEGEEISFVTSTLTKTVQGADIRGNVFGGGNNADVTGSTNVEIGK